MATENARSLLVPSLEQVPSSIKVTSGWETAYQPHAMFASMMYANSQMKIAASNFSRNFCLSIVRVRTEIIY